MPRRSLTTFYRGAIPDTKALAEALAPLPETADELRAIAVTLQASPEDIKLGDAASVTAVKRELLDNYRAASGFLNELTPTSFPSSDRRGPPELPGFIGVLRPEPMPSLVRISTTDGAASRNKETSRGPRLRGTISLNRVSNAAPAQIGKEISTSAAFGDAIASDGTSCATPGVKFSEAEL